MARGARRPREARPTACSIVHLPGQAQARRQGQQAEPSAGVCPARASPRLRVFPAITPLLGLRGSRFRPRLLSVLHFGHVWIPEDLEARMALEGDRGTWPQRRFGRPRPLKAVTRPQAARPASGFRYQTESAGKLKLAGARRLRGGAERGRGRECHVQLGARPRLSSSPLRMRGRSTWACGRAPGGARAYARGSGGGPWVSEFACAGARWVDWAGPAVFECSAVLRQRSSRAQREQTAFCTRARV